MALGKQARSFQTTSLFLGSSIISPGWSLYFSVPQFPQMSASPCCLVWAFGKRLLLCLSRCQYSQLGGPGSAKNSSSRKTGCVWEGREALCSRSIENPLPSGHSVLLGPWPGASSQWPHLSAAYRCQPDPVHWSLSISFSEGEPS